MKALPLFGFTRHPILAPIALTEHRALGADTVLIAISEDDRLAVEPNIVRQLTIARQTGLTVGLGTWNIAGLTGGDAIDASWLARQHGGQAEVVNAIYRQGPQAKRFKAAKAVTSTIFEACRSLHIYAAAGGAEFIFYDEMKIDHPARSEPAVDRRTVHRIARDASSRGLKRVFCQSYRDEHDLEIIEWLSREGLADTIAFDRYYGADNYQPEPEEYLGPLIDEVRSRVGPHQALLGTAQGFDLGKRTDLIPATAEVWRRHGVQDLLIWGGFCVNEHPFLNPPGAAGYGYAYEEIATAFDHRYRPTGLQERVRKFAPET